MVAVVVLGAVAEASAGIVVVGRTVTVVKGAVGVLGGSVVEDAVVTDVVTGAVVSEDVGTVC